MKKQVIMMVAAALVALPLTAAEVNNNGRQAPAPAGDLQARHEAFQKAHQEKQAQLKATQEKMEKLVKEYQKLKGKKQDAKKAEIAAMVASIREDQLKFNAQQLTQFEERLNQMRVNLAKDQAPEAKQAWVDEKTAAVIENGGDLKVLFGQGPRMDKQGRMGKKHKDHGKKMKHGKHGPFDGKGPKGPHPEMGDGGLLPPPPPAEGK